MASDLDKLFRSAKSDSGSILSSLPSWKTMAVGTGTGIASVLGLYALSRLWGRNKEKIPNQQVVGSSSEMDLISSYMDSLGTSGLRLSKRGKPLVNYGNTCFLNSALQVAFSDEGLSCLPYLIDFICHLKFTEKQHLDRQIIGHLMNLLINLNSDTDDESPEVLKTEHLIEHLEAKRGQEGFFANQQDCHEIMVILLGMINDIAESTRQMYYTLSPGMDDFGGTHRSKENNPFCGRISTSLKCHTCGDETAPCFRTFFDLTVNVKSQNQSIDELVKAACSTSEVVNQVHCSKCWLALIKSIAKDLEEPLKEKFIQKVKEIEQLAGCDYEEASNSP